MAGTAENPKRLTISFVVPAHNEEAWIERSVSAIHDAARAENVPYEVVVVDDASTDATAAIAARAGARVLPVNRRQISAARNAGARATLGKILLFVDADTLVNAAAVRGALRALRQGAVGGGCVFTFEGELPRWSRLLYPVTVWMARAARLVGGCCLFCTREAFERVGGFSEELYAGEELFFIHALKQIGRFEVPRATVITSGRKLRTYSGGRILQEAARWVIRGRSAYADRAGLDIWYGEQARDNN